MLKKKPTTTQQSVSPIHHTITTPQKKNDARQTTFQSTVKLTIVPK